MQDMITSTGRKIPGSLLSENITWPGDEGNMTGRIIKGHKQP
jgi:hypothetical protein